MDMTIPTLAYHFVGATLRDGSPVPPDHEWLEVAGPPSLCEHGLHASVDPFDAIKYAPGPVLCRVEIAGDIVRGTDKLVATRRRILRRVDMTDRLRDFARAQARSVLHLWDAPQVVRDYLDTGDQQIRSEAWIAARKAVWIAVPSEARNAARSAAWSAAPSTAWSAVRSMAWSAACRAAESAAWSATEDAAWSEARNAARDAAESATEDAARSEFNRFVAEAFA